jgi:lysophospholipase L1-like esterase
MFALFAGDSITEAGTWADVVCGARGERRVNQQPDNPCRAAISGTGLTVYSPLDFSFAQRVAPFALASLYVMLGTNDLHAFGLNPATGLSQWASGWDSLYAQIGGMVRRPDRVVIVGLPLITAVWPLPSWASSFADARTQMDSVSAYLAAGNGVHFVPLVGMTAAMVSADGVHPNPDGQAYIAQQVLLIP